MLMLVNLPIKTYCNIVLQKYPYPIHGIDRNSIIRGIFKHTKCNISMIIYKPQLLTISRHKRCEIN